MVDGPLWMLHGKVWTTGAPGRIAEFRYEEKRAGIVSTSLFDVSVQPVLDGLLVWW